MSNSTRIIKNTGFLYAKMGITIIISLYTTRLVLNALGASDFGIFSIVGGAIAMLGFLNVAMSSATQRFMSYSHGKGDEEEQKKIFNISIVLHFGIALLMGAMLLGLGYFLFNGILNIESSRLTASKVVYGSLVVSTIFTVMSVPYNAVLNAHENMFYYSIIGIIESLLKLGVAFLILNLNGDKLILFGFFMACIPIITLIIMRLYCHYKYDECTIYPRRYWNLKLVKEMTHFAKWNLISSSTSLVGNYGSGVILNHFFGTVLNASFGIASQLNGQLSTFSNSMMKALNPSIVKSEGAGRRSDMLHLSLNGCKYSLFLFAAFSIPCIIEMNMLLTLWLQNVPEWAVIFCQLALIRTILEQVTLPLNTAIGAHGNIKRFMIVKALVFLVPLPVTYVFFYYGFPPTTMLIINLIAGGLVNGYISLFFAIKNCGLKLKDFFNVVLKKMGFVSISTGCIAIIPFMLLDQSILRLIVIFSLSVVSITLLFFSIGLTSSERTFIYALINQFKTRVFKIVKIVV